MDFKNYIRGTLLLGIAQAVSLITLFIGNSIFTRVFFRSDMGYYALSYSLVTFFAILGTLGLEPGIIIHAGQSNKTGYFRKFILIRILIATLFCAILYLLSYPIASFYNASLLIPLIQISSFYLIASILSKFLYANYQIKEKFIPMAIILLITKILGLFLTIHIIFTYKTVISIYIGLMSTFFIEVITAAIFGYKFLYERSSIEIDDVKSIFKISIINHGYYLQEVLFDNIIVLLVGFTFTSDETAIFYYAYSLVTSLLYLSLIFRRMGLISFAKMDDDNRNKYIFTISKLGLLY